MNIPGVTTLFEMSMSMDEIDAFEEARVRAVAGHVDALLSAAAHLAQEHDFVCAAIKTARETTQSIHHTPFAESFGFKKRVQQ